MGDGRCWSLRTRARRIALRHRLGVLLERYGILTRELVELDPWAPAWADLAPLLARAHCAVSCVGATSSKGFPAFSTPATRPPKDCPGWRAHCLPGAEDILLAAADPGQPLRQWPSPGHPPARRRHRPAEPRSGNSIVMKNGRPVLVIERRTASSSAWPPPRSPRCTPPWPAWSSLPAPGGKFSRSKPTTASPPCKARLHPALPSWASFAIIRA